MTKDEALDLALEALEVGWSPTYTGLDAKEMGMKAITAIKQARSAPVQPVGDDWTPCMKLPVVVHVRQQRPGESHVSTREGITPVKPDDLIMRGVSGEEYPIGRAIFEQTYTLDTTPPSAPTVQEAMAAIDTLKFLGYTYHGGEKWKPPLGAAPVQKGWKLVPVVATREIEDAIGKARNLKASEIWEDALAATPPAAPVQKRPPNCGTGYCSCVECVMEPAAQPAQQEPINVAQAYAMAQVCLDLHDALGCKWGDNPYLAIDRLKTAAPVPLTDELIGKAWAVADGEHNASASVKRRITRSIEAAHGITKGQP
jgi:hypothetical protein